MRRYRAKNWCIYIVSNQKRKIMMRNRLRLQLRTDGQRARMPIPP
nr:MAG TPA: hypothetical protein [Herelleviridae sp.]